MFSVTDRDETLTFSSVTELETYLHQVAADDYTRKVLQWATSDTETAFSINNGPHDVDIWRKE